MKKIISFSLWGNNPKYTIGAIRNTELAKIHFPDWICRFYVDKTSIQTEILITLEKNGAELINCDPAGWDGMFWRFYAVEDSDIMISRDCDSRLSERDVAAVNEWLESGKAFHIIRDHPWHTTEILGGLWGVRGGILKNIRELVSNWCSGRPTGFLQIDQDFLKAVIYPMIKNDCLVHDEFFNYDNTKHKIKKREFFGFSLF